MNVAGGQIYETAPSGNAESNVRVQIGNLVTYVFSNQRKRWLLVRDTNALTGQAFP